MPHFDRLLGYEKELDYYTHDRELLNSKYCNTAQPHVSAANSEEMDLNTALKVVPSSNLINLHRFLQPTDIENTPRADFCLMNTRNSFGLQPLECIFDRQVCGHQSSEGKNDNPETHVPRFIHSDQRTMTILNNIQQ